MMANIGALAHLRANRDRIFSKLVEFASIQSWARYWEILGEACA
jgi:hypothetical protein